MPFLRESSWRNKRPSSICVLDRPVDMFFKRKEKVVLSQIRLATGASRGLSLAKMAQKAPAKKRIEQNTSKHRADGKDGVHIIYRTLEDFTVGSFLIVLVMVVVVLVVVLMVLGVVFV